MERNQAIGLSVIVIVVVSLGFIAVWNPPPPPDVRIGYLMNNKSFSIIEDSPNKKYDDFLVYIPYEQLVERCEYYLNNDDLRREKAKQAFQGFRKYSESEFLKLALAQSF